MGDDPMQFEWCIAVYDGPQATHVLSLAHSGVGYFIRRSEGSGRGAWVEAAFRRPTDSPRPEHLTVADPVASMKLDKMLAQRHHLADKEHPVVRASMETVAAIRERLEKRRQKR